MNEKPYGWLQRYREPALVLVMLVVPLAFYLANSKNEREMNLLDRILVTISSPVQWATSTTLAAVGQFWNGYIFLVGVQQENQKLRTEVANFQLQLTEREEQRLENQRLRFLLGLRERAGETKLVMAHVIAMSPSPLFRSVRIDVGVDQGVQIGNGVMNHQGVVGRVVVATSGYADVLLLIDSNSSTDVLVQRTRARARVRGAGKNNDLYTEYLGRTSDIRPGDILLTSGVGSTFPKGLMIGHVESTESGAFGLYQHATVRPSADFERLEELMVVLSGWSRGQTFEAHQDDENTQNQVVGP